MQHFNNNESKCILLCVLTEREPVEELKVWAEGGQLWLRWKPPKSTYLSEYVVEWVGGGQMDWQRENRSTSLTVLKGNLSLRNG